MTPPLAADFDADADDDSPELLDAAGEDVLHPLGSKVVELEIKKRLDPIRIDQYLAGAFPGYSRSLFKKAIDAGTVTVNGTPVKASHKVLFGDHIRLWLPEAAHPAPKAEDIPLDILYQDESLAIVNKPPNMVVHPARGNWSGTLVNALQFHFAHLSRADGDYRPGIVHRLDRDTSGVILVAKNEMTHRELSLQFEQRKIFKEYLAITQGVLDRDSDYIERPIGHHAHDRTKMATYDQADEERGIRESCTYYEVIERFQGFTYCRLHPKTGRTHQLRVHLAHVGCPVLADKAYSGRDCFRLAHLVPQLDGDADEILLARQALHARRLRFQHPVTRRLLEAEAPLPTDMERTLAALRTHRPAR